jgi:hypothetical protein
MVGDVLLLIRPEGPIDERPAAFSECFVILIEDGSPHRASTVIKVTHQ